VVLETTEVIPIGSLKYGDSSLIVHCFTQSKGMRSFLLKGILNSKKKGLRRSFFQPLTTIEIIASFKPSESLSFIREARVVRAFQSIPIDIRKKTLILFLSEMLFQVLKEEPQKNDSLFSFLKSSLHWLDTNDAVSNFHLKFLLDLTKYVGFYPNTENAQAPYFDLERGTMKFTQPKGLFLEGNLKISWLELLGTDFDTASTLKLNKGDRDTLLNHVIAFFELHLQRFKKPKSTSIFNEVFKRNA